LSSTRNIIKQSKFLGVTWWLGDLVAGRVSHQDTKTQSFTKIKRNIKPLKQSNYDILIVKNFKQKTAIPMTF
jgi:hypothetical protein